jgi:alpha-tubulin suppressor-like RCC1 family protein
MADGTVSCWGELSAAVSGEPSPVAGIADAARIALGYDYACVLAHSGDVTCWGGDVSGALGNGMRDDTNRVHPPSVAVHGARALVSAHLSRVNYVWLTDGSVLGWGWDAEGQLGDPPQQPTGNASQLMPTLLPSFDRFTSLAADDYTACGLRADGTVECWGNGFGGGLLGFPSGIDWVPPTALSGLTDVALIVKGNLHTCVRRTDRSLLCWGVNDSGQLGDGTTTDRSVPTPVQE